MYARTSFRVSTTCLIEKKKYENLTQIRVKDVLLEPAEIILDVTLFFLMILPVFPGIVRSEDLSDQP